MREGVIKYPYDSKSHSKLAVKQIGGSGNQWFDGTRHFQGVRYVSV